VSVNWNWPGEISATPPSSIHSLLGKVGSVVVKTLKAAPGVLVNANRNEPLGRSLAL